MAKVKTDIEFENFLDAASEDVDDPIVLAYRLGDSQRTVRLRRSEVRADAGLVEVGKTAQAVGYDPYESLNRDVRAVRPADSYIQQKIQFKLMAKEIRKRIDSKNLSLKSFPEIHDLKSMNDPVAHYILTLVTDQLITEGLWRDEDKDLTMTEAFPLSQATNESRIKLKGFDDIQESSIWQDSELTAEEISESSGQSQSPITPIQLPTYSFPILNNLMRASPKDLYHQVARRMIETHFFQDHPELNELYRSCYFAAKGVEDEAHFMDLMDAGLCNAFPHYTFSQFRLERVTLRKHIRVLIEKYFSQTPTIQRQLKIANHDDPNAMNVWARFYKVWNTLTSKQQEALECVYMDQSRLSKKAAAEKFGISINSLISRLRVAVNRFKMEFVEFEGMSPKRIPQKSLRGSVALSGLWRYQSAAWKSPLYAVDPLTGLRREIDWRKMPKSKNLDWKSVARIKAQIIENCPVPHILDTEYFDGMKPTIMSMGHRPEKIHDDGEGGQDLDAGFRDID
ncbi:hypothetical protein K2X05_04770 [bacterium]|nr:hypothetical protein [bacterium]